MLSWVEHEKSFITSGPGLFLRGLDTQGRQLSILPPFWKGIWLTHLSLASHKRDIGKPCRPRSNVAERGVWSGTTLFALRSEIATKHDNKN